MLNQAARKISLAHYTDSRNKAVKSNTKLCTKRPKSQNRFSMSQIMLYLACLAFTVCSTYSHGYDVHQSPYANEYPPLPKRNNQAEEPAPTDIKNLGKAPWDNTTQMTNEGIQANQDQVKLRDITTQKSAAMRANRQIAPDFRLRQRGGPGIRLSMLEGNISLLYFWNPSCQQCNKDIRTLEQLYKTYKNQAFLIFVVNTLTTPIGNIHPSAQRFKTTLPMLYPATRAVLAPYQLKSIPTTLLLDEHQRIVYRRQGYGIPGTSEFRLLIENELAALSQTVDSKAHTQ